MKYNIFLIFIALVITSCGPNIIYSHKVNIPSKWKYNESLCFEYEISNISIPYDLILRLVYNSEFDFENIYVNVTTLFPDNKKTINAVSLQLSNSDGTWIGNCDGSECTIDIEMSSKAYFENKGNYSLCFAQYSRKDSLEGFKSMELKVVESPK